MDVENVGPERARDAICGFRKNIVSKGARMRRPDPEFPARAVRPRLLEKNHQLKRNGGSKYFVKRDEPMNILFYVYWKSNLKHGIDFREIHSSSCHI